ncbi:DUF359 domain-containing protein, partial [Candidatus Bathyarchaeota archaeon]|nr:DUF359 domain-containing protein [Candidatus Bathyarchaeota archaeon]
MRNELKEPLGKLLRADITKNVETLRIILAKTKPPMFASVGDYVTVHILEAGLHPDVVVIDHRVMRQDVEQLRFDRDRVHVSNPQGTITAEAYRELEDAITLKKRLGVVVEGEEDLLVLP